MKTKLESLLRTKDTFFVEGSLNKNKIAELARKYDPELLELLMVDKEVKAYLIQLLCQIVLKYHFLQTKYLKWMHLEMRVEYHL